MFKRVYTLKEDNGSIKVIKYVMPPGRVHMLPEIISDALGLIKSNKVYMLADHDFIFDVSTELFGSPDKSQKTIHVKANAYNRCKLVLHGTFKVKPGDVFIRPKPFNPEE